MKTSLEDLLGKLTITTRSDESGTNGGAPSSLTGSTHSDGVAVRYFDTHDGFHANHTAPIRKEFRRLAKHHGWNTNSEKAKKHYFREFVKCCEDEAGLHIGRDATNLEAWKSICADLGITTVPNSINKCKKALKGQYLNIYDYTNCKRAGTPIRPIFTNKAQFSDYTRDGKIFPKEVAKKNSLLKALLEVLVPSRRG